MAKETTRPDDGISRDPAGRPTHKINEGDGSLHDLDMWVDVKITFPASQDGIGRPMDLYNLKRAVLALEAAGVDPQMSIEIERTERGFFLSTGG